MQMFYLDSYPPYYMKKFAILYNIFLKFILNLFNVSFLYIIFILSWFDAIDLSHKTVNVMCRKFSGALTDVIITASIVTSVD